MLSRTISIYTINLLFITFLAGCSDSSNGPDLSDLTENEQQLIGTWELISTEEGPNPGPVDYAVIRWTFEADYSGVYYQNPNSRPESTSDFYWKLEGNDIVFTNTKDGEGDPTYRIENYGETEMRWYNYTLGDYYIVEKQ